ncbi:hypothetical protein LZ31DRAFT_282879 [Colletotrichum somersetense]|nr:hypothetical protein LZ31DRAFT_282879 [Colletotrichum somersetense]
MAECRLCLCVSVGQSSVCPRGDGGAAQKTTTTTHQPPLAITHHTHTHKYTHLQQGLIDWLPHPPLPRKKLQVHRTNLNRRLVTLLIAKQSIISFPALSEDQQSLLQVLKTMAKEGRMLFGIPVWGGALLSPVCVRFAFASRDSVLGPLEAIPISRRAAARGGHTRPCRADGLKARIWKRGGGARLALAFADAASGGGSRWACFSVTKGIVTLLPLYPIRLSP